MSPSTRRLGRWAADRRSSPCRSPTGITEVAATSGEVSDRAAPTGGVAVLLLPGIDPYADGYTVEITDASGARTLTESELNPIELAGMARGLRTAAASAARRR